MHGHLQPLLPLATALRDLGHEVGFATGPAFLSTLRDMGYACFKAGADPLTFEQLIARFPSFGTVRPQEQRNFFFPKIFAGVEALPRAEDILQVITSWRPSVLVNEVAEMGGPLAAAREQVPHATVGFGAPVQPEVLAITAEVTREIWASWGMKQATPGGLYDHLYLDPCPPSLQPPDVSFIPNRRGMRAGTGPPPDKLSAAALTGFPDVGVIYITMGTVYGRDAQLYREVVAGTVPAGRPVIVTTGPHVAPSEIGIGGANLLCLPFLAQAAALPRCDLVVTHGGAGSVLGALAFGVPLLILPRGADQFYNAALVARAGAGRWLDPGEVSADSISKAVQELLTDPAYRAAARRIQAEIKSMPPPAEVAAVLADLATSQA